MTGDFRQTLPVIPKGTRADELYSSIKASYLWKHVKTFRLKKNVRVEMSGDPDASSFEEVLMRIGNGTLTKTGIVEVPPQVTVNSKNELIDAIFEDLAVNYNTPGWLSKRAILAPKNLTVDTLNEDLLNKIPGDKKTYHSKDFPIIAVDSTKYPTEVLNQMNFPGVPPHRLVLKKGAPIIIMRNIDPPILVNGTRLVVKEMGEHKIEATILVGDHAGEDVFIPRIPFIPRNVGIEMKRTQFPIRLSFSMSINKAQGQTLQKVGLYLEEPCFSHGQFYVGCSRVGTEKNLKILCPKNTTRNVVYQEALGELLPAR